MILCYPSALTFLLPLLTPQVGRIDHVDFYGLRSLERAAVEEILGLEAGDPVDVDRDALSAKLRAIDGIADARILLMSSPTTTIALVGIEENGATRLQLRPAPTNDFALPPEFHVAYHGALEESMNGLMKGLGREDTSAGHSLSTYPAARAHQDDILQLVPEHLALLRDTLRLASDAKERVVAAHAIAYCTDKASVIGDLAYAMTDPDSGVRNNAVRALSVLASWSNRDGGKLQFDFDAGPLLAMLESFEWTDRNKSGALLDALTVTRPAALLDRLRAESLPALTEMALWHSSGHALFSIRILARLAGLSEEEILRRSMEVGRDGFEARANWISELVANSGTEPGSSPHTSR